jgi:hypothetical protein
MNVVLGPDVFVNASVAPGSDPDKVAVRTLGGGRKVKVTPWILAQVKTMLGKVPQFKPELVEQQIERVRAVVEVLEEKTTHPAGAWAKALASAAKAAGVAFVVTDHPDLIAQGAEAGIDFITTENYLVDLAVPPPPPPPKS